MAAGMVIGATPGRMPRRPLSSSTVATCGMPLCARSPAYLAKKSLLFLSPGPLIRAGGGANQRPVGHRIERDIRQDGRRDVDRCDARQNATPPVVVEHGSHLRDALVLAQPLVAAEEERLVLDHRAAERSAELIAAEIRLLVLEVVRAVEAVVPEELERGAGEQVGARLGHDVEHAAARAAVFGAQRVVMTRNSLIVS